MKLALSTISFRHKAFSLEDIIHVCAEMGCQGIEIWADHLKPYHVNLNRIRKMAEKNNIEFPMISPFFNFSGSPEKTANNLSAGKKIVQCAAELGVPLIRCFSGLVSREFATKKQIRQCIESVQKLCDLAMAEGIKIALEPHQGTLADTSESVLDLIKEVNRENFGLVFDVWNLYDAERRNPVEILNQLYAHVLIVHGKNAIQGFNAVSAFEYIVDRNAELSQIRNLKDGLIDYDPIIKTLIDKKWGKYFTIESFETRRHPLRVAKENIMFVKRLINKYTK